MGGRTALGAAARRQSFYRPACLHPTRRFPSFRESWRDLRGERYDFAVDFQGLFKSALTATFARPRRIFGFHQSQIRERAAGLFYSDKPSANAAHVVDRNLELAAAAGAVAALRSSGCRPALPKENCPRAISCSRRPSPDGNPNSGPWRTTAISPLACAMSSECRWF